MLLRATNPDLCGRSNNFMLYVMSYDGSRENRFVSLRCIDLVVKHVWLARDTYLGKSMALTRQALLLAIRVDGAAHVVTVHRRLTLPTRRERNGLLE